MKTTSTPIETNKALLKDEEAKDVDVHLYRSMTGSLMYLTAFRLDIMFAVCACARFQVTPIRSQQHHACEEDLRYLKREDNSESVKGDVNGNFIDPERSEAKRCSCCGMYVMD
ncbi:hypothetical protein Tco_0366933 [Tanacetum coccineum]